ncbi:MAG: prepilin-type N-terminal cleavage/methylation domain-containing protein [Patescibacteria group bacterium]
MHTRNQKAGFSLIELIIVVLFLGIAGSAALLMFKNQEIGSLESEAQGVATRVREARGRAFAGVDGLAWGVHFENATTTPFYAIFPGSTYVSASSTVFNLGTLVRYATLSQGSSTEILFTKLSGTIATGTSVQFKLATDASKTKTVSVSAEGKVSVE